MAMVIHSAELTDKDENGFQGVIIWHKDGMPLVTLRVDSYAPNLEPYQREMTMCDLLDALQDGTRDPGVEVARLRAALDAMTAERNAARDNSIADCVKAVAAKKASRPILSHDAPLTPAEAMARCPEVAALVEAAAWYRGNVSWCNNFGPEGTEARDRLAKDIGSRAQAALAPFTKGSDG